MVSFGTAIANGWRNYVNFTGRSRRSEYWWWILFVVIVSVIASFIDTALGLNVGTASDTNSYAQSGIIGTLWSLATLLPGLALLVRRIRDAGHHWAWIFIVLLPIIGGIILFVFTLEGSKQTNANIGARPTYADQHMRTIY